MTPDIDYRGDRIRLEPKRPAAHPGAVALGIFAAMLAGCAAQADRNTPSQAPDPHAATAPSV
jgi:hypothetical protein